MGGAQHLLPLSWRWAAGSPVEGGALGAQIQHQARRPVYRPALAPAPGCLVCRLVARGRRAVSHTQCSQEDTPM